MKFCVGSALHWQIDFPALASVAVQNRFFAGRAAWQAARPFPASSHELRTKHPK
jgi:hypothetical protein